MKRLLPFVALLAAFALSNCSSSTAFGRIEKNPQIYNELSVSEQQLVSQGQIREGMSPGAVFLALGSPDRRLEGSAEGKRTMRWDYTGLTPVYSNNFFGHFGTGFGRHGRRYGSFGFGPSIDYVPVRSSTVWFENNRVRSYERLR